jgi:hypothetical protein
MRPRKRSKFKWFGRFCVLGIIIWIGWVYCGVHVTDSYGPISASKAESITGLKVPPEAANIRAATFHQWIETAQYLRFEAPVDVCLQYASLVNSGPVTQRADEYSLKDGVHLLRPEVFGDFSWFDLDKAQDVVTDGGGPSVPQVWVDRSRGVFYYRLTD